MDTSEQQMLELLPVFLIRDITPMYVIYRMVRYKEFNPVMGPFFLFNNLQLMSLIVYHQKILQIQVEDITIHLMLGIIYQVGYLAVSKQYAQIVYQFSILINLSWTIRQWEHYYIDLNWQAWQYLSNASLVYQIYKSLMEKEGSYFSKFSIFFQLIEGLVTLLICYVVDSKYWSLYPSLLKFVLIFMAMRIYLELKNRKKKQE